ncbi:MAG: GNAT family N-acetyltransferase [Coriobacteriia bacterium]|nr:GNAT family N-acetyltransferase [Coriobacteriia bacterium]
MPEPTIRPATDADAAAIAAIYNHYIRSSTATFDTEEKSVEDRLAWLGEHGGAHPVLVAQDEGGGVLAWGSLSKWGTRCAYRHSVEISVYVAPDATQAGLGPAMCEALIERGRELGHHAIVSQIVSENEPSLKMAARLGFENVGRLRQVGRKFDRWLDIILMELLVEPPSAEQAVL